MKMKTYSKFIAIIAIMLAGSASAPAQHQHGEKKAASQSSEQQKMQHDMSKMMREPHHVLAMAYMQNIGVFAKALRDQVKQTDSVNVEFARVAVAEIKRSHDEMERHHQEHMKTMSEDMRSRMSAMMKEMNMKRSKLKDHVAALEKDVQLDQPDPKQIAAHSDEILKHLDHMSKMHGVR